MHFLEPCYVCSIEAIFEVLKARKTVDCCGIRIRKVLSQVLFPLQHSTDAAVYFTEVTQSVTLFAWYPTWKMCCSLNFEWRLLPTLLSEYETTSVVLLGLALVS